MYLDFEKVCLVILGIKKHDAGSCFL